jgi:hypothetical protein
VSSRASLDQICLRLAFCLQYHPKCRQSTLHDHHERPIRFLDVNRGYGEVVRLTTLRTDYLPPYITLSYVWGKDQSSKTTLARLADHEAGIPIGSLPKTIRDAIDIARLVGVSLLWVDSLCIVQDDTQELVQEIANMAAYYGNSLLTLCVASAPTCDEGFLGFDPLPFVFKSEQSELCFRLPMMLPEQQGKAGHLEFRPHKEPRPEPIDQRAWTLQEGLLSKRLVTFSTEAISWSCPTADYGITRVSRLRRSFSRADSGRSWQVSRFNLSKTGEGGIYDQLRARKTNLAEMNVATLLQPAPEAISKGRLLMILAQWDDIVHEYSKRALSSSNDRLVAISGVAAEFSRRFALPHALNSPSYLAGLWWSLILPWQLLWTRDPRQRTIASPEAAYVAPSWSWASGSGTVDREMQRRVLEYHDADIEHVFSMAQGRVPESSSASIDAKVPALESSHIVLQSHWAPFGSLVLARLTIRGQFRALTTADSSQTSYEFDFDDGRLRRDLHQLSLLKIVRQPPSVKAVPAADPKTPAGLILEKIPYSPQYRRVGTFSFSWTYVPWKIETVEII